jgi:hypothetical protein
MGTTTQGRGLLRLGSSRRNFQVLAGFPTPEVKGWRPGVVRAAPTSVGNPSRTTDRYVFVGRRRAYFALVALLMGLLAATATCLAEALLRSSSSLLMVAAFPFVLALVAWQLLASSTPQVIVIDGSVITIKRGGRSERFDLCDPDVQVRARDGELAFAHRDDNWIVVEARDVEWSLFTDVVMGYQWFADASADERSRRYRL